MKKKKFLPNIPDEIKLLNKILADLRPKVQQKKREAHTEPGKANSMTSSR